MGPWLYGVVVLAAGHRWDMATVIPVLIVGALILLTVDERKPGPDRS